MQGGELRGQENLEWNTDLIEMMELKDVMSQAAQDLDDGETRRESREAEDREHEEVQWCSGRSRHQGAIRKLNSLTSRVEEMCLENACMHDVHITGPLSPTQHNHKGWRSAPDAILPGHRRAPQWVLARTPTAHWGPNNAEAVGGPHQRPKGEAHMP